MKKEVDKLKIILFAVIGILLIVVLYEYFTINNLKKSIQDLNVELGDTKDRLLANENQLQQVSQDKQILDEKYELLTADVAEIYKGCINDNKCKGRYPNVSWYCNNVGDEVSDPSHVCKCDSSCNLVTNPLQ